ncbi:hypothetical protein C8Q77DRAFT_1081163 [Trametes polyzona]|nr:hypothetical protein C8Q77DRAFT_1081163 [Trametes polyzona]
MTMLTKQGSATACSRKMEFPLPLASRPSGGVQVLPLVPIPTRTASRTRNLRSYVITMNPLPPISVQTTTDAGNDIVNIAQALQEHGTYLTDHILGATTPSDMSTANTPAVAPAPLSPPSSADSAVEAFSLPGLKPAADTHVDEAKALPVADLEPKPPKHPYDFSDDDDDGFIPRGPQANVSGGPQEADKAYHKTQAYCRQDLVGDIGTGHARRVCCLRWWQSGLAV